MEFYSCLMVSIEKGELYGLRPVPRSHTVAWASGMLMDFEGGVGFAVNEWQLRPFVGDRHRDASRLLARTA